MGIVRTSAIASLVAQLLIGAVTSVGFFIDVKSEQDREDLNTILTFEVSSQVIEFLWYAVVLLRSQTITARLRYIDWVLSTPVMLISLAMFFRHRDASSSSSSVFSVFESYEIYACLGVNWIMLAFGFAMESGWISEMIGLLGGGLALVGSFTFLAVLTPIDTMSHVLFWITFGVWGIYGVAAAFNDVTKNVMYNAIDIVWPLPFRVFADTSGIGRERPRRNGERRRSCAGCHRDTVRLYIRGWFGFWRMVVKCVGQKHTPDETGGKTVRHGRRGDDVHRGRMRRGSVVVARTQPTRTKCAHSDDDEQEK